MLYFDTGQGKGEGGGELERRLEGATHRVGRVLSVSPVVGIGTPPPL